MFVNQIPYVRTQFQNFNSGKKSSLLTLTEQGRFSLVSKRKGCPKKISWNYIILKIISKQQFPVQRFYQWTSVRIPSFYDIGGHSVISLNTYRKDKVHRKLTSKPNVYPIFILLMPRIY